MFQLSGFYCKVVLIVTSVPLYRVEKYITTLENPRPLHEGIHLQSQY